MRRRGSPRNAVAMSNPVAAVAIIVVLVVGAVAGYYASSGRTTTVTSTIGGGGTAVTSTVTNVVTGAGTTVTSTVSSTVTNTVTSTAKVNPPWNQSLVDLAKAEGGSVTCYCVMDTSDWPTMAKVLNQSFPWMKVNYVGLDPDDIITRAITEYNAGHVTADVLIDTYAIIVRAEQVGALFPWNDPVAAANQWSGDKYATIYWGLPVVIYWNTNLVKDNSTIPTTWQGIADPRWKGHLVIDSPSALNTAGPLFASLSTTMSNQSWTQFMKAVKANNPILTPSSDGVFTDLSTGQAWIGIGLLNDILGVPPPPPPLGTRVLSPVPIQPEAAAITKGAPHPYTAELFRMWFESYYGAVALASTGRPSGFNLVNVLYFPQYYSTSFTSYSMGTGTDLFSNPNKWITLFRNIFGQ